MERWALRAKCCILNAPEQPAQQQPWKTKHLCQNRNPKSRPSTGHEFDGFLGKAFEEKPIWTGLYESIRDVFFPVKLPPLQLTSTPIPVPDRMAVKPNPWAIGISSAVNISLLVLLLVFGVRRIIDTVNERQLHATDIDVGTWQPKAPKAGDANGGGGGGGEHSIIDPIKGHLPKIDKNPIVPPQVETVDKPKIAMDAAIMVQQNITLPDNPLLATLGVTKSPNVTVALRRPGFRQWHRNRFGRRPRLRQR